MDGYTGCLGFLAKPELSKCSCLLVKDFIDLRFFVGGCVFQQPFGICWKEILYFNSLGRFCSAGKTVKHGAHSFITEA
jgi:hypothetical protein